LRAPHPAPYGARLAAWQGQTAFAKSTGKDAKEINLHLTLKRGINQMQAWFQNAEGAAPLIVKSGE